MLNIWLLIISGVILVPIISGTTKELENRLQNMADKNKEDIKILWFKIDDQEDLETLIKVLNYIIIGAFIIMVVMMVRFTSRLIYDN